MPFLCKIKFYHLIPIFVYLCYCFPYYIWIYRPAQRKNEAVNFSKLISNGYGTGWLQQCTGRDKKIEETSENSDQSKGKIFESCFFSSELGFQGNSRGQPESFVFGYSET